MGNILWNPSLTEEEIELGEAGQRARKKKALQEKLAKLKKNSKKINFQKKG